MSTPPLSPDPVYTVVAEMFEEFAADLERSALRIRRGAEMLRAAETDPDDNSKHSLKIVGTDEEYRGDDLGRAFGGPKVVPDEVPSL